MRVSINGDIQKWAVQNGKSHWNAWFRGTSILGNLHLIITTGLERSHSTESQTKGEKKKIKLHRLEYLEILSTKNGEDGAFLWKHLPEYGILILKHLECRWSQPSKTPSKDKPQTSSWELSNNPGDFFVAILGPSLCEFSCAILMLFFDGINMYKPSSLLIHSLLEIHSCF